MHDTSVLLKAFGPTLLPQITKNIAITDNELEQQAKEIARLELALRQSRERHQQLKANRDRLINTAAPINGPPPEILGRIFEQGALDDPLHFAVTVSHVSHGWRERALSNPRLWNHIQATSNNDLPRLRVWIERSKACPLDIDLSLETAESMIQHLQLLRPHLPRWRSLTLASPDATVLYLAARQLDQEAPRLADLSVTLNSDSPSQEPLDKFFDLKWKAPSLCSFTLIGIPMPWSMTLPSTLESLVLGLNDESRAPSINDVVSLLSRSSNLKSLSIHAAPGGIEIPEEPRELEERVELPQLQDLSLQFVQGDHVALRSFLERIFAPTLRTFELRSSAEFRTQGAFEVIGSTRCPFPSLEHLKLASCEIRPALFNAALQHLPSITELTLERCQLGSRVLELMNKSATQTGEDVVAPMLKQLNMKMCSGLPSDAVKRFVQARLSYSIPIQTLGLDRCAMSSMQNPWFKKNVARFVWRT